MPVTLYHSSYSPPSRVALLTIRYLNIDAKIHHMDMMNGENMEEYYLKINPQHTIPTLDDNGFYLNESRAIASYLAETRAPGSALFPKDPKEQAIINQRLYYDMGTLFPKFYQFVLPLFQGATEVPKKHTDEIVEALGYMEEFLENNVYVAGYDVTIADLSLLATVSTLIQMGLDVTQFKRIAAWYDRCRSLPGFDENEEGAKILGNMTKEKVGHDFKF